VQVARALRDLATLAKLPISLLAALSAGTGFLAAAREARPPLAATLAGTFLLAAGAAALNEVIERRADARMERTRDRPIPSGRIGAAVATLLAAVAAAGGTALLWSRAGAAPALLGLSALAWYDAVYTPLKRVTPFAFLPGAVVGALPPAMGWIAAGGGGSDPGLHALCGLFLLWQVAHSWLIALRHADELERGGFPSPARRFSARQAARITFAWVLAAAGALLLLPLFGLVASRGASLGLAAGALLLAGVAASALPDRFGTGSRRAAIAVDLMAVAAMALVAGDALLGS
jgi:protoheme IX farnesyltransferase